MVFNVARYEYVVRRKHNLTFQGKPADALFSSDHYIFVDADLDRRAMEGALRHEVVEAWQYELGGPREGDSEAQANFTAAVSDAFDKDWAAGGVDAVLALPVEGERPAREPTSQQPYRATDFKYCICGRPCMLGSIFTSEKPLMTAGNILYVERGFRCECRQLNIWEETCDRDGRPQGVYLSAKLLNGTEAQQWLEKHPLPELEFA